MVNLVFKYSGFRPYKIIYKKDIPTSPLNRVSDSTLAKNLLGGRQNLVLKRA